MRYFLLPNLIVSFSQIKSIFISSQNNFIMNRYQMYRKLKKSFYCYFWSCDGTSTYLLKGPLWRAVTGRDDTMSTIVWYAMLNICCYVTSQWLCLVWVAFGEQKKMVYTKKLGIHWLFLYNNTGCISIIMFIYFKTHILLVIYFTFAWK